jgi:hypothetical protein
MSLNPLLIAILLGLIMVAAGLFSRARAQGPPPQNTGRYRTRNPPAAKVENTQFFGSQVGGPSVINYAYTDLPWNLLVWDIRTFFTLAWALPWILWPVRPCDGGDFDELSFTRANLFCVFIHVILVVLQIGFILVLPFTVLLPVWILIIGLVVFFSSNWALCWLLNGSSLVFQSEPKYAQELEKHAHEKWIFLNGVAVGSVPTDSILLATSC